MPRLEQREECRDLVLLRDYPDRVLRLDCLHCDQIGRYSRRRLMERFGPAAGLPEVPAALPADSPRRQDWRTTDPATLASRA